MSLRLAAFCSLTALFVLFPLTGYAGTYTPTYSGGAVTYSPPTPALKADYALQSGAYGGGYGMMTRSSPPQNPITVKIDAAGTIKTTFT